MDAAQRHDLGYWVNNYLLGQPPPAWDVLYWNSDQQTNMPAGLHRDFVQMGLDNGLTKPGEVEVLGTPVDLSKITCDTYVIAGILAPTSHHGSRPTAPRSCSAPIRTSSSPRARPIVAMVNPPGKDKANYKVNESNPETAGEWLKTATTHEGSRWPDMDRLAGGALGQGPGGTPGAGIGRLPRARRGAGHLRAAVGRKPSAMSEFEGRTVFMSGGSRGIGLAIAVRLAAEGATRRPDGQDRRAAPYVCRGRSTPLLMRSRAAGGEALPLVGDIRDADAVEQGGGADRSSASAGSTSWSTTPARSTSRRWPTCRSSASI